MANEMPDTKATIHQLLKAVGIRRVVYVDDVFTATAPRVLEACNDLTLSQIRETKLFPDNVFFEPEDDDVSRNLIRRQIEQMTRAEIVRVFATIAGLQGNGIDPVDPDAVQGFVDFFADEVKILTLNLPSFRRTLERLLAEVSPSETLFVFDEDFRHDGGSEREGRRLAAELVEKIVDQPTFLALLTHTVTGENNNEDQTQTAIEREYPGLKDRLVVIAKRRLAEPQEGFAWRFKLALLSQMFGGLRDQLRTSIAGAQQAANDQLEDLDVEDFERIVFHSSHIEGAWAPETLARVFGIHFGKQLLRDFRTSEKIHTLAEQATKVSLVSTAGVSEDTRSRAAQFQRIEMYDDDEFVNPLHLALGIGDVFKTLDGNRYFVVLAQPCDLAVRSHGLRRGKQFDDRFQVVLAEIQKTNPEKLEDSQHRLNLFESDDSQVWCVFLNCLFSLPAWLLDLAVFNTAGTCRINCNQASLPLLIPAWRVRLRKLIERAGQRLAKCRSAGNSDAELLQMVLALPPGGPFHAVQSGGENDWALELNLQRIRRIREPFATDLYTHYGHWITRTGFPHEFTRLEVK
jgi:hypothetical protein